jgi:hypothetical protein
MYIYIYIYILHDMMTLYIFIYCNETSFENDYECAI